jgi:hypothetical protein
MKKLGIGLAFAAALLMTTVSSKPANAGTTEIVAAVVGAIVTIATIQCAVAPSAGTVPFICLWKQPTQEASKNKTVKTGSLQKTIAAKNQRSNYEQLAAMH